MPILFLFIIPITIIALFGILLEIFFNKQ
jgi:hypothetical protein